MIKWSPIIIATIALAGPLAAQTSGDRFTTIDVFQLERTVDPQISPSSDQIVYVRNSFDIMTDAHPIQRWARWVA